jgi:MFS family permease
MLLFTQIPVDGTYAANLLPGFLIIALGMALCFVPISIAALAGVKQAEAGIASGLINTSQQIGGAVGIALLSTVAITRTENAAAAGTDMPHALTSGFQLAFWVGAGIAIVGVVAALVLIRQEEIAAAPETAPVPAA